MFCLFVWRNSVVSVVMVCIWSFVMCLFIGWVCVYCLLFALFGFDLVVVCVV